MKNMKKLLQKAMVFTLSAAMLVGTPMTASAAGLVDLYSISDGENIVDDSNKGPTGTVTNTDTNTGALIKAQSAKIVGIALDRETVNAEAGTPETLKATVMLDSDIKVPKEYGSDELIDITDDVVAEMSKKIKWEVLYVDENGKPMGDDDAPNPAEKVAIEGKADNRSEITLNPWHGTEKGEEVTVRATIDASYYFDGEVSVPEGNKEKDELNWTNWKSKRDKYIIKDDAREGLIYTADAKVSVKEYSTGLKWSDDKEASTMQLKHTIDLGAMLVRDPKTANDAITWVSSDPKVAAVSATGVVTAKKAGTATADITAVSERGAVATRTITVEQGVKADVVKIFVGDDNKTGATTEKDLANPDDSTMTLVAKMYAKVSAYKDADGNVIQSVDLLEGATLTKNVEIENGQSYIDDSGKLQTVKITDVITWTSNKAAVATVAADGTVTLTGVGTAAITAKATNGKSAKTTVKVAATLKSIAIEDAPKTTVYSGQTFNLTATKTPAANKDAVKWSIEQTGKKKNPNATINAKGVLKIANKVDTTTEYGDKVTVVVTSGTNAKPISAKAEITVAQSTVDTITVKDGDKVVAFGGFGSDNKKYTAKTDPKAASETIDINATLSRTFEASVTNNGTDKCDASLLTWKTSNAKVAAITSTGAKATIKAVGAGTATITVSGVRLANGKASALNVTFKVKVKQPVTVLTMSKPTVTLAEKKNKKGDTQNQKVSLKVTFGPKKADKSQTKIASWTVQNPDGTEEILANSKGNITAASVSVNLSEPKAGDVYKITAKSITGATATSTVTIVAPTTAVRIVDANNNSEFGKKGAELAVGGKLSVKSQINLQTKNDPNWVDAGDESVNAEDVTYTVNKKGIITVDQNGNVYAIKKGTVTITAKTPTGKKATLKVTVN